MDWKTALKNIGIFFVLFAAVVGAGCSLGYLGHYGHWFPFVAEFAVIGLAVPTWIKLLKQIL